MYYCQMPYAVAGYADGDGVSVVVAVVVVMLLRSIAPPHRTHPSHGSGQSQPSRSLVILGRGQAEQGQAAHQVKNAGRPKFRSASQAATTPA
jgi:hypothetical protein